MATFKFCMECNNMLYPKEDRVNHQLLYSCRNCMYTERSDTPLIYRNELMTQLAPTAGATDNLTSDPTLPRSNTECPKCMHHECVFFQSQQRRAETNMILFYVCVNCNNIFRLHQ